MRAVAASCTSAACGTPAQTSETTTNLLSTHCHLICSFCAAPPSLLAPPRSPRPALLLLRVPLSSPVPHPPCTLGRLLVSVCSSEISAGASSAEEQSKEQQGAQGWERAAREKVAGSQGRERGSQRGRGGGAAGHKTEGWAGGGPAGSARGMQGHARGHRRPTTAPPGGRGGGLMSSRPAPPSRGRCARAGPQRCG